MTLEPGQAVIPDRPEWVVRFPPFMAPEQIKELGERINAQMEAGEKVLLLPDGAYLESTQPMPFYPTDYGASRLREGVGITTPTWFSVLVGFVSGLVIAAGVMTMAQ